ncbi:YigZ family protein [Clostridiaceae bacterium]|nr:YigZ family protein [Clostridiaceae bacterium]RKI11202.1 YigZ family protein [bacterium 1XD21-70]
MMEAYKILYQGGEGELVEKKSRFIATTRPVKTEEEAAAFVEETKKKYWDARHNCHAYVIGERGQLCRCSDDGEPAQTAGRPMLDVLLGEGVRDACVVVTRYFGGTLLGTGGLVRAYSGAVQEALRHSVIVEKTPGRRLRVVTDYNGIGKIQYVAAQLGVLVLDTEYTEQVAVTLMAPLPLERQLIAQVTERTAGKARIEDGGTCYYGLAQGEVLQF